MQFAVTWGFVASFLHDSLAIKHGRMIFHLPKCPHALSAISRRICGRLTRLCPGVKVWTRSDRTMSQGRRHEGTAVVLSHVNMCGARVMDHLMAKIAVALSWALLTQGDYGGRTMWVIIEMGRPFVAWTLCLLCMCTAKTISFNKSFKRIIPLVQCRYTSLKGVTSTLYLAALYILIFSLVLENCWNRSICLGN